MSNPQGPDRPPSNGPADPTQPPAPEGDPAAGRSWEAQQPAPPGWGSEQQQGWGQQHGAGQQQPGWQQTPSGWDAAQNQPPQGAQNQGPQSHPPSGWEAQQPAPGWGQDQQQGWGQQQPGWQQPQQPWEQQPAQQQPQQPWEQQPAQQQPQQAWDQQQTQVVGWGQQQPSAWGQQPAWGQQQTWGQPGYQAPREGRAKWPWFVLAGVLVVLALVGVLGFVAPGFFVTRVFDPAAVQDGVRRVLTSDYRVDGVQSVTCPPDQRVVEGATFECRANIEGSDTPIKITVRSADGRYEVRAPPNR